MCCSVAMNSRISAGDPFQNPEVAVHGLPLSCPCSPVNSSQRKTLVVGATGATGRLLVDHQLKRGHDV